MIRRLAEYPPDAVVVVNMGKNELANGKEARSVELVRAYRRPDQNYWSEDHFPDSPPDPDEVRETVLNITG
jgi:hypothetical protein